MKRIIPILILMALGFGLNQCKITYSFTGASISPMVKSYTIYDFPNRAQLINPTLSDYFAEKLRDKFTRQTSLDYAKDGGDLELEGTITDYDIKPISVQSGDQAAQNRLTVKINVKFTNNTDHDQDYEQEFSAYSEFDSENNISDVEDELVEIIVTQIVDDVFNKSVANW